MSHSPHRLISRLTNHTRGLEKALDAMEAERNADLAKAAKPGERSSESGEGKERDVRRVLMRERRAAAWRHLHVLERDVLTVLSAICKVRSSVNSACSDLGRMHMLERDVLTVLSAICKVRDCGERMES